MTSKPEPFELVKASPFLMQQFSDGEIEPEEAERRALGAQRLKERLSSIPFYAAAAASDPEYWNLVYASVINT